MGFGPLAFVIPITILSSSFFARADEGISGTKANRPALDRLMAAVENDEVSSVVVYSFSRFARKY